MPAKKRRFSDLFIPIGRRAYSLPPDTVITVAGVATSGNSASEVEFKPDASRFPTTDPHLSIKNSGTVPSSKVRYTISAQTHGARNGGIQRLVSSASTPSVARSNTVHIRQVARPSDVITTSAGPARPHSYHVLSSERSEQGTKCAPSSPEQDPTTQTLHESAMRVLAPTSFTSPDGDFFPDLDSTNGLSGKAYQDAPRPSSIVTIGSLESLAASADSVPVKQRCRSVSRSSSNSSKDRVYPPAAFPSKFYERFPTKQDSWSLPSSSRALETISGETSMTMRKYTISGGDTRPSIPSKLPKDDTEINHNSSSNHVASGDLGMIDRRQNIVSSSSFSVLSSKSHSETQSSHQSFHHTVHYYTTCPHSSPPATRPLNVQPTIEISTQTSGMNSSSPRSVIQGSCFECDTSFRRDAETELLLLYNPEIAGIVEELGNLVDSVENLSLDPSAEPAHRTEKQSRTAPVVQALEQMTINNSQENCPDQPENQDLDLLASRVYEVEYRIDSMTARRDREIKEVWKGYTARWGPGTLGVANFTPSTRVKALSGTSTPSARSSSRILGYGSEPPTPDTSGSSNRFGHRRGLSRESTGSTWTSGLVNDKGTPDGRMRVDWIRDDLK